MVGGQETIDGKFFTHNVGFDFALMVGNYQAEQNALTGLIKRQIQISEELCKLIETKGGKKKLYETRFDLQ